MFGLRTGMLDERNLLLQTPHFSNLQTKILIFKKNFGIYSQSHIFNLG